MIISTGIDILEFKKIKNILEVNQQSFLNKIYTSQEIKYAKKNQWITNLASTFAAKEAVFKAISHLGLTGICFKEIEIIRKKNGKPTVRLSGQTKKVVDKLGATKILISLSTCSTFAVAQTILVKTNPSS
jgi:holo-[acyl-carrier protein] synthase